MTEFHVEPYEADKHYQTLVNWWEGHDWPAIPKEYLPKNGFVIEGLCAGFVYFSDSKLAFMEWIVSNPLSSPMRTYRAIELMVEFIKEFSKDSGYEAVFTMAKNRGLIRLYETSGFQKTDSEMTHMLWRG